MTDIMPGDVVVCVDNGPVKTIDGIREVGRHEDFAIENLKKDRLYRVSRVIQGKTIIGVVFDRERVGGWVGRFRKVRPADPEFAELIKRHRQPSKIGEPA